MLRIVVDTNILVAALRSKRGASHEILRLFRQRKFGLILSNTVLTEYEEILKAQAQAGNITQDARTIDRFLDALCSAAELFQPSAAWKPSLPDPDDEAIAQLASESGADYLLTYNLRDFPSARLPGVRVIAPRNFLCILREGS